MRGMIKGAMALGVAAIALATPASAHHSWGKYHWARTSNPITVQVVSNVNSTWASYVQSSNTDWNQSQVIKSPLVNGGNQSACDNGVAGTIQVCNAAYGSNGWLGIASINITNGSHISLGTVKLNDTYFNTAKYNTPAWRQFVACQEVGHTYGLDHQNEAFNNKNLGTCMDYTNDPDGGGFYGLSNLHPNAHDYEQLMTIYSHLDSFQTFALKGNGAGAFKATGNSPKEWGRAIHFDEYGRPDMFERVDGPGLTTVTHVFWALETPRMR